MNTGNNSTDLIEPELLELMVSAAGAFASAHPSDAANETSGSSASDDPNLTLREVEKVSAASFNNISEAMTDYIRNFCPYIVLVSNPECKYYISHSVNIGRFPHNDILLSDGTVSRIHCRIFIADHKYYLINMGTNSDLLLNGVCVNNYMPNDSRALFGYELSDGDLVTIGRLVFRFCKR